MRRKAFLVALVIVSVIVARFMAVRVVPRSTVSAQQQAEVVPSRTISWDGLTIQLRLGVRDTAPTRWEGKFELSAGKVLRADILRRGPGDSLTGNQFQLQTRRARQDRPAMVGNGLLITVDAPPTARLIVTTNQGEFRVPLSDLADGQRIVRLGRQANAQSVPNAVAVAATAREEDFPAAAVADDGTIFATYVEHEHCGVANLNPLPREPENFESFRPAGGGDRLMFTWLTGNQWADPVAVTEGGQDLWRPAVAIDGDGRVWVVWSQNVEGNWELFARPFNSKSSGWSGGARRLTTAAGSDIHVALTPGSSGAAWLAWQAWRGSGFDIHVGKLDEQGLSAVAKLGTAGSNQWSPAITSDSQGNVFVAYDSYEAGNYDIQLATIKEDQPASAKTPVRSIADSPRFEVRPSVVCDGDDRLWIAWEERAENWGKDDWGAIHAGPGSALYRAGSTVRVVCLAGNQSAGTPIQQTAIQETEADLWENFQLPGSRTMNGYPRLAVDPTGRVWLAMRQRGQRLAPAGTFWQSFVTTYDGNQWSAPTLLPHSDNLLDNRPALLPQGRNRMLALFSGDGRTRFTRAPQINNQLFAATIERKGDVRPPQLVVASSNESAVEPAATVHPNELEEVDRVRSYRCEVAGKTYQLVRGEFHRHTEISGDGGGDGSLEDMWRYGLDAARMDWIGNGDHDNGSGREYTWWLIQKTTDIFHHPPHFTPMYTYERSVRFPDGHRNVMFAERGIRPLPRLRPQQNESKPNNVSSKDTPMLYRYLKRFDGICAVHTSATNMGTDWRDNDPDVEPIVEIYQGDRNNYEHIGAPRSGQEATQVGGYQPEGFVWNALEKGYRLGFQASSDHISTHISYAVALVEEPTREQILDAFKRRHCYGATDNIVLVVSCDDHLMGDEFSTSKKPTLEISALGTNPIARVSIVKDLNYVYRTAPLETQIKIRWTDNDATAGAPSLYYVRIEQEDGQIAWASPMWIRYMK